MDTQPIVDAVEAHLRIHQIADHNGTITCVLANLLIGYGIRTGHDATRRLALFAGDLSPE
jgi:hypothetical protein